MSNENMASLFRTRKVARKSTLKAKEIRADLAAYFMRGGEEEW
jgi:hypothetical protein